MASINTEDMDVGTLRTERGAGNVSTAGINVAMAETVYVCGNSLCHRNERRHGRE